MQQWLDDYDPGSNTLQAKICLVYFSRHLNVPGS